MKELMLSVVAAVSLVSVAAVSPASPAAHTVQIKGFAFSPKSLTVTTNQDYTVAVNDGGRRLDLGVLKGTGTERELFVSHPPRVKEVFLFDGPRAAIATR
jgi:hypothetical protein